MANPPPDRQRQRELEELFAGCFADVWRFARRRTASAADADDVTAEVFATACRRHAELPPTGERRLWLFGVARHIVANHRRSATRRQQLQARILSVRHEEATEADPGLDGELLRALAELSEADRDLLVMRAWDGFAVAEIATLLGATPNAVSLRLTKARQRLQRLLDQTGSDGTGHVPGDPARQEGTTRG